MYNTNAITLNRGWTQETHTTLVNNSRPNTNNKRHGSHQKLWWGWTLETHTTLVNNSRPNTNDKQHGSHQNLWRCELKRHRQHWWTIQEETKKRWTTRTPSSHEERVNRRHTDNIDDQVKNKLKEWATGTPSKTGEWWAQVLRRAYYFPLM